MPQATVDVNAQLERVTTRIADDYADRIAEQDIRVLVREAYEPLAAASVTQFVPVLVDRTVRAQLRRRGR